MRENRMYGSEGGGDELNRPFLPLSLGSFLLERGSYLIPWGFQQQPSKGKPQ